METQDKMGKTENKWENRHQRGRMWGGLTVVVVGAFFLARQMGVEFPHWLFTWEMLLIVIGIYTGLKHNFRNAGWIILILLGSIFLIDDVVPGIEISNYIWPLAIIAAGLWMIFIPKKRCRNGHWNQKWEKHAANFAEQTSSEDYLDSTSVFGGVKRNIISKNFKGGEVTCVFGGAEINLIQADFTGRVELEITCVMGGANLIVPANWKIQTEVTAIMGSIEDKRPILKEVIFDENKTLVLKGNAVMGGIEIRSY